MNISSWLPQATKFAHRAALIAQKHAPEILTYGGLASMTIGAGLSVKKSFRYMEVVSEPELEHLVLIEDTREKFPEKYSETDVRNDKIMVYTRLLVRTVKHYAVGGALFIGGAAMVVFGHRISMSRIAGLTAAYASLDASYRTLLSRISDKVEDPKKGDLLDDILDTKISVDEAGKMTSLTSVNPYEFYFDSSNSNYGTKEMNETFLRSQEAYFNDRLRAHGYVFLNEVLEALGLPRTPAGQIVGWLDGHGDDFISFGASSGWNERYTEENGYECGYILDFNVDGPIWDMI